MVRPTAKRDKKDRIEVSYDNSQGMTTPVQNDDGNGGLAPGCLYSFLQVRDAEWIEW